MLQTLMVQKVKAIHDHGIPKTKNFFKKIFLRNYHFTILFFIVSF